MREYIDILPRYMGYMMEYAGMIQWIGLLFLFALVIGVIAPIGGVGGGVLFVPLATAFFPFSVDFIRGAGLIIALTLIFALV